MICICISCILNSLYAIRGTVTLISQLDFYLFQLLLLGFVVFCKRRNIRSFDNLNFILTKSVGGCCKNTNMLHKEVGTSFMKTSYVKVKGTF